LIKPSDEPPIREEAALCLTLWLVLKYLMQLLTNIFRPAQQKIRQPSDYC